MKILTLFIACLLFAFSLPARIMEQVYDTNNAAAVDAHVLSLFTNGIAATSTNFNSGFVYTNDSSQSLLVAASIGMSSSSGAAFSSMSILLYNTNGGVTLGKNLTFNFGSATTLTNTIACIIPPHYGYVFTNLSTGNGTAAIAAGTGQIVAIGAGPQGPQGPAGAAGGADTNANNIWSGVNQFTNTGNIFSGNGSGLTNLNASQLNGPATITSLSGATVVQPVFNRGNIGSQNDHGIGGPYTSRAYGGPYSLPTEFTYRHKYTCTATCTDPQLVYSSAQGEIASTNPIVVKGSIEDWSGNIYLALWNGCRTNILQTNSYFAVSDKIPDLVCLKGSNYWVRTTIWVDNTNQVFPIGGVRAEETTEWATNNADLTEGGTAVDAVTVFGSVGVAGYGPVEVIGRVPATTKCIAIVGDSIGAGYPNQTPFGGSWPVLGLGPTNTIGSQLGMNFSYENISIGTQIMPPVVIKGEGMLIDGCNIILGQLGINNIDGASTSYFSAQHLTFSQMTNVYSIYWNQRVALGKRVFWSTILPDTTSTDGFITIDNQTPNNYNGTEESVRLQFNTWLRTVPPPLSGIFDAEMTIRATNGSGAIVWLPNMTADGRHPNMAADWVISRCVDTSKF